MRLFKMLSFYLPGKSGYYARPVTDSTAEMHNKHDTVCERNTFEGDRKFYTLCFVFLIPKNYRFRELLKDYVQ